MNPSDNIQTKVLINTVAALGMLLILAGLVWLMYFYTRPEPPDHARWKERKRNLVELQAHNKEMLDAYGWTDQNRGLVRLPINRAMELTVEEWRNPAQGRASLLAKLEKAIPAPSQAPTNSTVPAVKK